MRSAEKAAFARGVEVEALMDQAGAGIARAVTKFLSSPGTCIVFAGKGHNAGDALVAAQSLRSRGWKIEIRLAYQENECSELTRKKLGSLREAENVAQASRLRSDENASRRLAPLLILDGLLGVGAKPPLREPVRAACREINQLRQKNSAYVFAVDLPTGLDGDSGKTDRDCVIADFTVTIGFAKSGLVADGALDFVGRL
jgi:hydroxyethylthiazole kinase-like uncharacterized protein yjeF